MLYYDLELKSQSINQQIQDSSSIIDQEITDIQKNSELSAKIDELMNHFKKINPRDNIEHQHNIAVNMKINELQLKINDLQKELTVIKAECNFNEDPFNDDKESLSVAVLDRRNEFIGSVENLFEERTDFLTGHVWPKSRMLLAIVSKMSKEKLLNPSQRGILKDLIIENDPRILQCLRQYELDGDRKNLYKNYLNLAANTYLNK